MMNNYVPVTHPERRYEVSLIAPRWEISGRLYANVPVWFFVGKRPGDECEAPPEGASQEECRRFVAEQELFTEAEADALIAWLKRHQGLVAVKDRTDEIPERVIPWCLCDIGPRDGYWDLYEEAGYDLPFRVEGWYDAEEADYVGPGHERPRTLETLDLWVQPMFGILGEIAARENRS